MQLIRSLVLASALTVSLSPMAQAQVRQAARPAPSAVRPVPVRPAPAPVRPKVATPQRGPVVVARPQPIDPDPGIERERLRNACFNSPNPPVPLCRRVFGQN